MTADGHGSGEWSRGAWAVSDPRRYLALEHPGRWGAPALGAAFALEPHHCRTDDEWMALLDRLEAALAPIVARGPNASPRRTGFRKNL